MAEVLAESEDDEKPAQWMPECDDCDNPAEHYCTTCGDKLCPCCKDHHLSRKRNRDHKVVSYSAGMRAGQKSKTTCLKHPREKYQMYCKTCEILVCTPCVTQSHSGHEFISIPDAFSLARETAISKLEELTKVIKPRVDKECKSAEKSETGAIKDLDRIEMEIIGRKKVLHEMVDVVFEENMKQFTRMKEESILPILQKQKTECYGLHRDVENSIREYEDNLRSKDPIHLISFMNGRGAKDLQSLFPELVIDEVPMPKFEVVSLTRQSILSYFGALTLREFRSEIQTAETQISMSNIERVQEKEDAFVVNLPKIRDDSEKTHGDLKIMKHPDRVYEFTCKTNAFVSLFALRTLTSDKIWMSGYGRVVVLVGKEGTVLRTVNVKCKMYESSGMYCTEDGELIYCDTDGRAVRKLSHNFHKATLFITGRSKPRGIHQLQSGYWVVCITDEGVLRVYGGAGKVVREVGQGHLQRPYYVTVNRANDDICVSDNASQVIVFNSSGEKRLTYTGHGNTRTGFTPWDVCCDKLGNILITDHKNHRVHILDRDGHFLQYLASGEENISYPITIDIDDRGYAWVGECYTGNVKAYKYLSKYITLPTTQQS